MSSDDKVMIVERICDAIVVVALFLCIAWIAFLMLTPRPLDCPQTHLEVKQK